MKWRTLSRHRRRDLFIRSCPKMTGSSSRIRRRERFRTVPQSSLGPAVPTWWKLHQEAGLASVGLVNLWTGWRKWTTSKLEMMVSSVWHSRRASFCIELWKGELSSITSYRVRALVTDTYKIQMCSSSLLCRNENVPGCWYSNGCHLCILSFWNYRAIEGGWYLRVLGCGAKRIPWTAPWRKRHPCLYLGVEEAYWQTCLSWIEYQGYSNCWT